MQTFRTGYKPNLPHVKARDAHVAGRPLVRRLSQAGILRSIGGGMLRAFLGDPMDQGQTGACTGHAFSEGLWVASRNLVLGGKRPSPDGIYDLERELEAPGAPLEDVGAMPSNGITAIRTIGIRPMLKLAPDGRLSDCDPATINDPPTLDDLEEDLETLMMGAHPIGPQFIDDMRTSIDAGAPVTIAVPGGSNAWQGYDGSGVLDAKDVAGEQLDHYVLAYGYQSGPTGQLEWLIRNSWGWGWGRDGDALVTSAFLGITDDRYAIQVAA